MVKLKCGTVDKFPNVAHPVAVHTLEKRISTDQLPTSGSGDVHSGID